MLVGGSNPGKDRDGQRGSFKMQGFDNYLSNGEFQASVMDEWTVYGSFLSQEAQWYKSCT